MGTENDEKRVHRRVQYDVEDGIIANFLLSNGDVFAALIRNLSAGGISLYVAQDQSEKINTGDRLVLQQIIGTTHLDVVHNINTQVEWIKSVGDEGYVGVGCHYEDVTTEVESQLVKFVDAERMERGQYGS